MWEDAKERDSCKELLSSHSVNLTSGIKYGTDFLAYLGEPGCVHSSFTLNANARMNFQTLAALVRVSSSTKKDFVACTPGQNILFTRFTRFFL
ncbi:hypothetical protein NEAUS04_2424 [Nematocida ausubeli]|uniref:tRNA-intron lyase n=1 Tax=Nematocida ausubeli (strain ATCC PRA-371 / ERTm2) TaxID=1913371 RepID=H8ZBM0_NEMA1|nr:hypothetical protein NERG_00969 [Nematocida ausubeli]KAI5138209.1 hypothetical protein NEAUS06_2449 [Nematocida ausubeli]KAI5151154.1 hypothetical protein NEAUS05_2420 [Nematocida ausubeli]KAI5159775.1 hypothetical protein NEAUS03_0577 [Nematocida ausubeli]KAI5164997.1 hypothetical protein NEAUS04_2424 [Nematocida ausubeli]